MKNEQDGYSMLGYTSKDALKQALEDDGLSFSMEDLQKIIDGEFFDDNNPMDADLIDAASRRIAILKGISTEEQIKETAYAAFRKLFSKEK